MVSNRKARLIVLAALMRRESLRVFHNHGVKVHGVEVRVWYDKQS